MLYSYLLFYLNNFELIHILHDRYYIPVNQMLGYCYDEDGKLQIKEDEAYIIKTIYRLYLSGLGCAKIANYLKERKKNT